MNVTLPGKTLKNGSFYIHFALLEHGTSLDQPVSTHSVISATHSRITKYSLPKTEAFNLMGANTTNKNDSRPVTHLYTRVTLSVMTDNVSFNRKAVLPELYPLLTVDRHTASYLPMLIVDRLSLRQKDLQVNILELIYVEQNSIGPN